MADFVSPAWSWFIIVTTLVSVAALFFLNAWLSARRPAGADPEETSGHVWDEDLEEYNNPLPRWWLNLFYITLVWSVLYLVAYPGLGAIKGFLGWSQEAQYDAEMAAAEDKYAPLYKRFLDTDLAALAKDPQATVVGGRLFNNHCSTCHGSDARGARGFPNLRDGDWLYGGTPEAVKTTILTGRQGVMPPWGAIIPPDGQKDVVAYVERLSGRQVDAAAAERGAAVYQANCIACHGPDGKGNPMLGAPNLTDDIWLYGGSTEKIAESVAKGRMGQMPAHGELLGEGKVHVLAAYVLSLQGDAGSPAPAAQ